MEYTRNTIMSCYLCTCAFVDNCSLPSATVESMMYMEAEIQTCYDIWINKIGVKIRIYFDVVVGPP